MNSFKVIKAYLVKKAQETIPDSPERREALEDLKRGPYGIAEYLEGGLITREEALPYALEVLKKYPYKVSMYFTEGILTKEEALPYALEVLKEGSHKVGTYFEIGLITREEARPFVLKNLKVHPYYALDYFKTGLITKEEALPYALGIVVEEEPRYLVVCVREKLITKEEALSFVLERLKEAPDRSAYYFDQGLITKEEARPFVLEHLKTDPSSVGSYFQERIITKEEALTFALEHLKDYPSQLDRYRRMGILTKQDVNDFLSGHLSTDANDFSHAHTLNLELLQKLRSLAKKGGGSVAPSEVPQLKKFFSGKPSLSVADIDKMIAREQQQNKHNAYSFDHHIWDRRHAQNSFEQDQLIIKVSALPKALQSEIDSKPYLKKFMDYVENNTTGHPSTYGWARVHTKKPGTWIIDEIQSDVVTIARRALNDDLRDHEAEIKAFASKHFADSMRKLILSAVTERAHKAGINKIEHMNVEFKADQNLSPYRSFTTDKRYTQDQHRQPIKVVDSNGKLADTTKGNVKDSDIPLPEHYVDTYHEGPQKAGFERDDSTGRWVKFSRRK